LIRVLIIHKAVISFVKELEGEFKRDLIGSLIQKDSSFAMVISEALEKRVSASLFPD
jgi:hypothetical protein